MADRQTIVFLCARALSAAVNVLSIAAFTRLAGPADYGEYLVIFAWAIIVFGFATQWMKFAYFGVYRSVRDDEFLSSFGALLAASIGIVFVLTCLSILLGFVRPGFGFSVFALVAGMTIYEASFEASRVRQDTATLIRAMLLRAGLMLALGCLALKIAESAQSLAYAIAFAHIAAAIPALASFRGVQLGERSRNAAFELVRYGWPLAISFGVLATGQSIDRLLLAYYAGVEKMAPYGVLADFLRQTYMVVGEAIALSLMTRAKHLFNSGERAACESVMRKAFISCMATSVFGALFFIYFGNLIVAIVLGPEFRGPANEIMAPLAIAFAFMVMRSFYFNQVIYFSSATVLELSSAIMFVLVSAVAVTLLVPRYGAFGAALALMLAHVASCVFLSAAGRKQFALPVDYNAAGFIFLLAAIFASVCYFLERTVNSPVLLIGIEGAFFVACATAVLFRYQLWGAGIANESGPIAE